MDQQKAVNKAKTRTTAVLKIPVMYASAKNVRIEYRTKF